MYKRGVEVAFGWAGTQTSYVGRPLSSPSERKSDEEYAERISVLMRDEDWVKTRLRKLIGIIPGQVIL